MCWMLLCATHGSSKLNPRDTDQYPKHTELRQLKIVTLAPVFLAHSRVLQLLIREHGNMGSFQATGATMAGNGRYNFNENLMALAMFWIVIGQLAAWFIFDSGTASIVVTTVFFTLIVASFLTGKKEQQS